MTSLNVTIYKPTGKFYLEYQVKTEKDIPLYQTEDLKRLLKENKVSYSPDSFVLIQDAPDGDGFHNHLFRGSEL